MIDAREITLSLGGKWYRTYGAAPCPICQSGREKAQNALTIADGRNGGWFLIVRSLHAHFPIYLLLLA